LKRFFDTNVLAYAFPGAEKRDRALEALAHGGVISAQVLGEFTNVARKKHGRPWPDIEAALDVIRGCFSEIVPVTADTHAAAVALAKAHGFAIYDALIVAAAVEASGDTLISEDMQDGRAMQGLAVRNPFAEAP